jgi:nicotinate-nucleotide adenylyltransferase
VDVSERIGIMGGTFDPIHDGHLVAAEETAWALELDRVLFIPTYLPPHKHEPVTSAAHRVAMVKVAIADNPVFELSTIEVERGGRSYTVDTLDQLHSIYPGAQFHLIVGMDSLEDLPEWHDPAGILRLARIAAVHRSGWNVVDLDKLAEAVPAAAGRVMIIRIPGLDISSTDLRARIQDGHPIRYLMPDPVIAYITVNNLYRAEDETDGTFPSPVHRAPRRRS